MGYDEGGLRAAFVFSGMEISARIFSSARTPNWDGCFDLGVPPSPRFSRIIELGEKFEKIYGAQSVAGKILISKSLGARNSRTKFQNGTNARFAHRHGLDHDCAFGKADARLDVTD